MCLRQANEQADAKRVLFTSLVLVLFNQMKLQAAQNMGHVRLTEFRKAEKRKRGNPDSGHAAMHLLETQRAAALSPV